MKNENIILTGSSISNCLNYRGRFCKFSKDGGETFVYGILQDVDLDGNNQIAFYIDDHNSYDYCEVVMTLSEIFALVQDNVLDINGRG